MSGKFNWQDHRSHIPPGCSGPWQVVRRTLTPEAAAFQQLRAQIKGHGRWAPPGEYTLLEREGTVIMSDTPDEINDHRGPILNALGHCLITGLGLGIVAQACAANPAVEHVTVVEQSADVIKLVAPHLRYGSKITVVQADALQWRPPRGVFYCMVWHDIWDTISGDNLPQMRLLRRRYARRSLWQGCWAEHHARAMW